MRKFLVLLEREMKSYFYSPVAYIVLCFFLALAGFNTYFVVTVLTRGPSDIALTEAFFGNIIFWFVFLPVIPFITMRLYSEEFKSGTIETLMTAPVEDWQVVASKFAGALLFYIVLWLPTVLHFVIYQVHHGERRRTRAGAVLRRLFPAAAHGHVLPVAGLPGLGAHAQPDHRGRHHPGARAARIFRGLAGLRPAQRQSGLPRHRGVFFQLRAHARTISRGLIDTQAIVFYISMTIFLQVLTYHVFQYRKWKA